MKILDKLLFETNLYCSQKGKLGNISLEDMYVFLGINIIMGYHHLPSVSHYWMMGDDIGVSAIQKAMTRDRFRYILGNLHVNDNSKLDKQDKIYKVRPLVEGLNERFRDKRAPLQHLSIDESMIRFKGRSCLKQYNPMKPIKRGYKLWCLCDNDGYVYKFEIYTGKKDKKESPSSQKLTLGGHIVLTMTDHLCGKNHKLFFDNYFSSVPLMEILQGLDFLACGTIRPNRRDFPPLASEKLMKRGDFDFRSTPNGITAYKWMDSKAVHLISNYHGTETTTVQRREKNGSKKVVTCPQVVKDYNAYMGGVDKHDMLRQLYGINRKSKNGGTGYFLVCLTWLLLMPMLCTRKPLKEVHHSWTFVGS